MAQEQPKRPSKEEEEEEEDKEATEVMEIMMNEETNNGRFRFNAQAPEFVPRTKTQMPVSGYIYPCLHILGVPISVIAATKRIKSLTTNKNMLAQALRSSSKLAVSDDGKKVKRKRPFTEKDREELQSRTVVVEHLPEDHSHQNLEKIFRVAGRVKTVRVCHPQEPNSSRSKGDFFVSNKLHALVEYETTETAEKAVEKLNDERNWRKGLRVRLLLRCSPKSVLKNRRSEFDGILDDDEAPSSESAEDTFHPSHHADSITEINGEESSAGSKNQWGRGRGKGRGRGRVPNHTGRGLLAPSPQSSNGIPGETTSPKQSSKGPRMPDGTRGFAVGRGKPLKT
ncbi:hypothetical protein TIFTF001_006896 [Ficus carica]|uniref:RNA-binding protein n=1 Tax=Ficus carica TaxID=3494 RepID=A0AA87ZJZ7_FICCA|nr:hypothetical protein TIFTF001_006896 [Ficus carica]